MELHWLSIPVADSVSEESLHEETLPEGLEGSTGAYWSFPALPSCCERKEELALPSGISISCQGLAKRWEATLPVGVGHVLELESLGTPGEFPSAEPQKRAPTPPDISKGLGQRQDKKDLVKLERFVINSIPLMIYGGELYIYESTCWRQGDERWSEMKIREVLQRLPLSDCLVQRDYQAIRKALLINPELEVPGSIDPPIDKLNCLDGTYDLCTGRLCPHGPDDHFFTCINVSWRESYDCPGTVFEAFVQQISAGNPDIREQLLQLVALTILGVQVKHFFVLLGPSNTGKSQFGRFLQELVGQDNVGSVRDMQDFSGQWTTGSLRGKMLATCLNLPNGSLPSAAVGIIKQFVGDDPIKGEQKYGAPFTFYRKPVLLFAGNYAIRVPHMEQEQAFLNRMVVIPFQNPVDAGSMRQQLYIELLQEAPYIVREALEAYERLRKRNFEILRTELPPEYQTQGSRPGYHSVKEFLKKRCDLKAGSQITTRALYESYMDFAFGGNEEVPGMIQFSRCLREQLSQWPGVKELKRVNGREERGYQGLCLREE